MWEYEAGSPARRDGDVTDPSNKSTLPMAKNVRCKGTTKDGSRCKNRARDGSLYCHLHQDQETSPDQESARDRDAAKSPKTAQNQRTVQAPKEHRRGGGKASGITMALIAAVVGFLIGFVVGRQ